MNFKSKVVSEYKGIKESQRYAQKIGIRAAKINNADNCNKYVRASRIRQVSKKITPVNLPIIGAAIGFVAPIPFFSIVLGSIGAISGIGLYVYKKADKNLHNA